MKNLIPVILVLAATVGCQERPDDRELARTGDAAAVQEAQTNPVQAHPDPRDASPTAGMGRRNGMSNAGNPDEADYAMAASRARVAHAAARQKCDALIGEPRSRCESTAGTRYEAALADAEVNRTRVANEASLPPSEDSSNPLRRQ